MTITSLITELAEKRRALETTVLLRREMEDSIKSHPSYIANERIAEAARTRIAEIEPMLQQAAIDEYRATANKKPFEGVQVKLFTTLKYDPVVALDWARKSLPEALTLDKRLFEQHAKGVAKTQPVPVVEIVEEPRAQIASDLSKFLAEEEPIRASDFYIPDTRIEP